mmetsp:Transcript_58644/g.143408  ORF Transcript_58644/g.143408 Transcript_58644/m.143408 type:complete len:538 (+) Transcript_58644:197-1810(+)
MNKCNDHRRTKQKNGTISTCTTTTTRYTKRILFPSILIQVVTVLLLLISVLSSKSESFTPTTRETNPSAYYNTKSKLSYTTTSSTISSLKMSRPTSTPSWNTASAEAAAPFNDRPYDLIIYGATGFTGQIACAYVKEHYPNLKVAYAGRNLSKLQNVRSQVYGGSSNSTSEGKDLQLPPLIVADAVKDPESLNELAASTRVIANYAGTPFIDKALPVVEACAKHGTCYTDITGEAPFQRASYDRYNKLATETGACIVHACGYDSVPSDLGAFIAANEMKERHGCECTSIELVAQPGKGGVSGGTLHTGMTLMFGSKDQKADELPGMREIKARGGNCYGLDPDGAKGGNDTADTVMMPTYDEVAKTAVIPFVMAGANAPVVRKTNAVLNYLYGANCSYREVQAVPNLAVGWLGMAGFGLFGALIAFPPTRWFLLNYVLPKPGEGPSKEIQETGYFVSDIYAVGNSKDKPVIHAYVKSGNAGDPGYKATGRMSIEASLCMALQRDLCAKGGVLTPASALGKTLVDRLNKTGMELGVTAK